MGPRSAPGARANSNARTEILDRAPETDAGTRYAVARGPDSGGWISRKKRPSARASRGLHDTGDALRTNRLLASALRVSTPERARDVLTAAVLCESLALGPDEADVRSAVTRVRDAFPRDAVRVRGVSVARASARHGYLVADAPGVVFVACAGTRDARDLVTDASVRSSDLVPAASERTALSNRSGRALAAHGGFAARARALRAPVRVLFRNAVLRDGKRLVLCGHSLGGAVAALALLGLLLDVEDAEARASSSRDATPGGDAADASAATRERDGLAARLVADDVLACVGFAAPPPGDEATRAFAETMGWTRAFVNVCSREDFVPRLMLAPRAARGAESAYGSSVTGKPRAKNGPKTSWRIAYAHVSPLHVVARDGAVTVADARDAPRDAVEAADRAPPDAGGGFFSLGPFSLSTRKAREALAEHTMRAHRARLLVMCATALADERGTEQGNARPVGPTRWLRWFGSRGGAGSVGSESRENGDAETGLPPPAGDALGSAPQPRPRSAVAMVERVGASQPSLLVTVRGEDLELCVGVAAETDGWPCAVTLVPTEKHASPGTKSSRDDVFVSRDDDVLTVRVYPPTFNGALVPAPLFGGGGDARDWKRVVLALRGDFGYARVAAHVERASGFAEASRSRL